MRCHLRRSGMFAIAFVLVATGTGLPAIAVADTPTSSSCVVQTPNNSGRPNDQPLKVCASFDKSSYLSSDIIKLTLQITNLGTAPATNVSVFPQSSFRLWGNQTGLFIGPGRDIPAGLTVTVEQDGYSSNPSSGAVTFSGPVFQGTPFGFNYPPQISITASVTPVRAPYGGTIFDDKNRDGIQDANEPGVPGAIVQLFGPFNGLDNQNGQSQLTAITDRQGHFRFNDLPGGVYFVSATGGRTNLSVHVPNGQVTVDNSPGQTSVAYPARSPLSDILSAAMNFDQASYHVGESAHLTITLTNTSPNVTISRIKTSCNHVGGDSGVWGIGAGWDQLTTGTGVTLTPGQTWTGHLSEVVLASAAVGGQYFAECVFGPDALGDFAGEPDPQTSVTALPSLTPTIDATLKLIDDDPVGGTPNFPTVLLVDEATQDPIVSPLDSSAGRIIGIPIGCYGLTIIGGWHLAPGQTNIMDTGALTNGEWDVHVLPGDAPAPPITVQPCASTPPSSHTG
jgi:hypothetical protein